MQLFVLLGVEDHLRESGAVAEVDKNHGTEVAAAVDPAHEHDGLCVIRRAELPASVGTPKVAEEIQLHK